MRKNIKCHNNFQEVRMNKNISQEELADQVNVSIQTIKSIEKGKYKPSKSLSITIANSLNQELASIFPDLEV